MSNFKWNDRFQERITSDSENINIVMFVSRNKDNKTLPDFKERRETFPTTWDIDDSRLNEKFDDFANRGQNGELSRFYYSVNGRDQIKVRKALQHFIIDFPETVNMAALPALITRVAMKRENAGSKRRLFDFDIQDEKILNEFISDLKSRGLNDAQIHSKQTINGYAIIIDHGVDLRGLIDTMPDVRPNQKKDKGPWKWNSDTVTYKIDDLILAGWTLTKMSKSSEIKK